MKLDDLTRYLYGCTHILWTTYFVYLVVKSPGLDSLDELLVWLAMKPSIFRNGSHYKPITCTCIHCTPNTKSPYTIESHNLRITYKLNMSKTWLGTEVTLGTSQNNHIITGTKHFMTHRIPFYLQSISLSLVQGLW